MSVVAAACAALGLLAVILCWFNNGTKKGKFYKTIPSPPGYSLLGNALDFLSTRAILPSLQRYITKCGKIVKVNVRPLHNVIIIADYKFLEFILSSNKIINKSTEYRYLHNWLGDGLLTSQSSKWKKHRRIITPGFHFKILEQFIQLFESSGNVMVNKLNKYSGSSIDIYPVVTLCALDIICETAMGTTVNAQKNEQSDYVQSVKEISRIVVERSISPIQMYDPLYIFTKNYYAEKAALKILHNYTNNVIINRKQEKLKKTNEVQESDFGTKKKNAFLDLLLEATVDGRPLTQQAIREEVDTFMFEGHDTTSSGISFALYCLANHPEIQQRAFEEQQQLFDDVTNCTVNYSDLQNIKYLEQVIKETLRLYAPRDPEYFTNPEEFNPSRFDEIYGRKPYAYIPFGAGPRNCIGQKFAMLELKTAISNVLRNFELFPAIPRDNLELAFEAIFKSVNGVKIGLKLRSTL